MEERSLGEGKDMIHMYFNFKIVLNILKLCFYKEEFVLWASMQPDLMEDFLNWGSHLLTGSHQCQVDTG